MLEYILGAIFGLIIGFIGGYAGICGSTIYIFLLTTFLAYPQHLAQGTVVAIMLFPMSLPSVILMWKRVKHYLKFIFIGVITYAIFSYFGASISYSLSNYQMKLLFSIFLIIIGIKYIIPHHIKEKHVQIIPLNNWTIALLGIIVGLMGGLFGIGAGVLMVPILIMLFDLEKDDARAISLAMLLPPVSIGAVIKYQIHGDINWIMVLIGFVAYFISNYFGAKIGNRDTPEHFKKIMGLILILLGILGLIGI
jgi:uncharacterized protein